MLIDFHPNRLSAAIKSAHIFQPFKKIIFTMKDFSLFPDLFESREERRGEQIHGLRPQNKCGKSSEMITDYRNQAF